MDMEGSSNKEPRKKRVPEKLASTMLTEGEIEEGFRSLKVPGFKKGKLPSKEEARFLLERRKLRAGALAQGEEKWDLGLAVQVGIVLALSRIFCSHHLFSRTYLCFFTTFLPFSLSEVASLSLMVPHSSPLRRRLHQQSSRFHLVSRSISPAFPHT